MDALQVTVALENLRCIDEGDGWGSAEPYLWVVFFKIDADTVATGKPAIVTTPGDHGNLGRRAVGAGENVPIPSALGRLDTVLRPLPVAGREGESRIGGVVVLMEQDQTPGRAVARGHAQFNAEIAAKLQAFVFKAATGSFPTQAEIDAAVADVGARVREAVKKELSFFEKLRNQDDQIGELFFMYSLKELHAAAPGGIPLRKRWRREGDWELTGRITAAPVPG